MLNHPELRSEIVSLLPTPDLTDMEEKLNFLKKNIYKVYRTGQQCCGSISPRIRISMLKEGIQLWIRILKEADPKQWWQGWTTAVQVTEVYILHPPPPPGGKKWPSRLGGKNVKCFMSSFWTQPYKWLGRYKRKSVSAGIRLHTIQSLFIGPVQTVKIKLSHIL